MRALAVVLAGSLVAAGCVADTYQVSHAELARLAHTPPAQRGASVRVDQEIQASDVSPVDPVADDTTIILLPSVRVSTGDARPRGSWHDGTGGGRAGHGGSGGHGGSSGSGGDAKGEAIAVIVAAVAILFIAAAVEGQRFDGQVQLHPMHPLHLIGPDESDLVVPLAWLDPNMAAWADHAVVRAQEGPWRPLSRASLERHFAYGVYVGEGSFTSVDGSKAVGPASTIQTGYFPNQTVGVLATAFLGWRNNAAGANLFESRYTLELQALPLVAGPLHLGGYAGGGFDVRFEDALDGGNSSGGVLTGGAMFQLELHTRVALTARLGLALAHGEQMQDVLFGLSVY